jgi:hypothetical protein
MTTYHVYPRLGETKLIHNTNPIVFQLYTPAEYTIRHAEIWTNISPSRHWHSISLVRQCNLVSCYNLTLLRAPTSFILYCTTISPSELPPHDTYEFCVRLRLESDADWMYLGPEGPGRNGTIIIHPSYEIHSPEQLFCNQFFHQLNIIGSSSYDDGVCWTLSVPVSNGSKGSRSIWELGCLKGVTRSVTLSRPNAWWLSPSVYEPQEGMMRVAPNDRDTQFLLAQCVGGYYVLVVPITSLACEVALRSKEDGMIVIHCVNESGEAQDATVSISIGSDPYVLVDKTADWISSEILKPSLHNERRISESIYDTHLGYCTWNAFGHEISYSHLISALTSLRANNIPVGYILIDDGWQSEEGSLLQSFEANQQKFPNGLRNSIAELRTSHPEIHFVGVWHTMFGYWHGVDPKSFDAKYKIISIPPGRMCADQQSPGSHIISEDDVKRFYDDFYAFLADAGVGMVKVDNLGAFDNLDMATFFENGGDYKIVGKYLTAVRSAAKKRFDNRVIYCMGMSPKYIFNVYNSSSTDNYEDSSVPEVRPILR